MFDAASRTARLAVGLVMTILFALAPLICARFCELRHGAGRHAEMHVVSVAHPPYSHSHVGHAQHIDTHALEPAPASASATDAPPWLEIRQALLALVELLPPTLMLIVMMLAFRIIRAPAPALLARAMPMRPRPPRARVRR